MSKNHFEYGIICDRSDEKKIVKNINTFMADKYGYRKMYKSTHTSFLEARLPYVYTHFYNQFLKQGPRWYFECYPNTDEQTQTKFKDHPEAGWILFINKMAYDVSEHQAHLDTFFEELLRATGFETRLLHQYADGEERL